MEPMRCVSFARQLARRPVVFVTTSLRGTARGDLSKTFSSSATPSAGEDGAAPRPPRANHTQQNRRQNRRNWDSEIRRPNSNSNSTGESAASSAVTASFQRLQDRSARKRAAAAAAAASAPAEPTSSTSSASPAATLESAITATLATWPHATRDDIADAVAIQRLGTHAPQIQRRFIPGEVYSPSELARPPNYRPRQPLMFTGDKFKAAGVYDPLILYDDAVLLSDYVSTIGRIYPRSVTGTSAKNHTKVARAIKRARAAGLLSTNHKAIPRL
ncbi:mitochondrial 37S ribosomal protein bS18m [Limtongia smithiae]|uniref:mitochondrial 37S ribosomal protein bS18m n=1 Tax=Limtongia smithiae TaxID=1125753 RepID=UPI0034CD2F87